MARLMIGFRNSQKKLVTEETITANTYNERIKTLRHFAGWLYGNYLVPALPRKIGEICAV